MKNTMPFVSVIIPVRNEERYIRRCLDSIVGQDYPRENIEVIVVDGMSEDKTREILAEYRDRYANIILIDNPNKIVPKSMNLGIRSAKGDYIIRMDAHAIYPREYVSKCIEYALKTDADNVGGVWETVGKDYVGEAIALALTSKFGVGNAIYRTEQFEGYVDTVPFGCFKRSVFARAGMFNEKLVRNQDIEFNSRIRRAGGKIFLTTQIKSSYYCRNNMIDLWKQNYANGYWNIKTIRENPHSLSVRHFIPLFFVASVALFALLGLFFSLGRWLLALDLGAYLIANLIFSIRAPLKYWPIMPLVYLSLHISYGLGSIVSLVKTIIGNLRLNVAVSILIVMSSICYAEKVDLNNRFMIGIYSVNPIRAIKECKEAGFNCVQTYENKLPYLQAYISECRRNSLFALVYPGLDFRKYGQTNESQVKELVSKNNPPNVIWYIGDEPDLKKDPAAHQKVSALNSAVKSADPDATTTLTAGWWTDYADWANIADVFMIDIYPIGKKGYNDDIKFVSEHTKKAVQAVTG
ncbi:MAG: glycosyltransferase family 2 protein, partial [candidate division Zixibacteria bacterium]|nr:glycosyltransferase family 2 protein [candidate division Zixibacteria bacterium]